MGRETTKESSKEYRCKVCEEGESSIVMVIKLDMKIRQAKILKIKVERRK